MYCSYLLALFVLLGTGIDANRSANPNKINHDASSFQATSQRQGNSSSAINTNFAMSPNQMLELENALNNVVNKFLGPQKRKLSLRTTDDENTGIIYTIQSIGDAIFRHIKKLFVALGLISPSKPESLDSYRPDEPGLKATVYYQLLSIPLRLAPYWQAAQKHLKNHFQRRNYHKMGYRKAKFGFELGYGISTDQMKISAIFGTVATYGGHFYDCLELAEPSAFNLKRTLGNLTNYSPEVTGRRLRSRLQRPIPRCPNRNKEDYHQYHAFVCLALADNSRREYYDCLAEVKRVDKCVYKKINGSEVVDSALKSGKFEKLFWLKLRSLEVCNNDEDGEEISLADCNLKSKTRRRISFPDMVSYLVGDTKKSSKLRRMANKFGAMITKSRVGSETLNEVVTLVEIYKNGLEKKARLMKIAQRDPGKNSIFTRISKVLSGFRQYIKDVTYKTLKHLNSAVTTVQQIIVQSASTFVGQDLAPNFKTRVCWSSWVKSVLVEWSHERSHFPTGHIHQRSNSDRFGNGSEPHRSRDLIKVPNEVGFIKSPHEEPLNELIVAMKSLGRPKKQRRSTALVSLANTFLLATMFYECISLLAGAIYCGDSGSVSPSNSAENNEPWRSSPPSFPEPAPLNPQGENEQEEPLLTIYTVRPTVPTVFPNIEEAQESVENPAENPFSQEPEEPEDHVDSE